VFGDTSIARIRQLQGAGHLEICIDAAGEAELADVLTRKFARRSLDAKGQAAALAHCRRLTTRVAAQLSTPERARLPQCRDPDDQKFLELAVAANADVLITKDRALLDLSRRRKAQVGRPVPFRILTPEEFDDG
jgi:predicted nucleic acid-binding protein